MLGWAFHAGLTGKESVLISSLLGRLIISFPENTPCNCHSLTMASAEYLKKFPLKGEITVEHGLFKQGYSHSWLLYQYLEADDITKTTRTYHKRNIIKNIIDVYAIGCVPMVLCLDCSLFSPWSMLYKKSDRVNKEVETSKEQIPKIMTFFKYWENKLIEEDSSFACHYERLIKG